MHPFEIRDRRYRLQKEIASLDAETMQEQIDSMEAEVRELQAICPHESKQEAPDQGIWRCRDCDLKGALEGAAAAGDDASDKAAGAETGAEGTRE